MNEGDLAPDFELRDQDGNPVALSAHRGRKIVVYFYPRADTPGCTTQACGVRDHLPDYQQADAVVLGVSPDPVAKVKRFHDKQGLNFTLLADEDHAVAEMVGSESFGGDFLPAARSLGDKGFEATYRVGIQFVGEQTPEFGNRHGLRRA